MDMVTRSLLAPKEVISHNKKNCVFLAENRAVL